MASKATPAEISAMLGKVARVRDFLEQAGREARHEAEAQLRRVRDMSTDQAKAIRDACSVLIDQGIGKVHDVVALREEASKRVNEEGAMSAASAAASQADGMQMPRPITEISDATTAAAEITVVPPRPRGMATPEQVKPFMKDRQWKDPKKWATTLQQWEDLLKHVVSTEKYRVLKQQKGVVSMYDLKDHFIIPWTSGTGCGAAVLMNQMEEAPDATLMLSHAWAEDVEECMTAMSEKMSKMIIEWNVSKDKVHVWFCVFANYQCEDGKGPTVQQQLEMDPFETVIKSDSVKHHYHGHGMCAIHTMQADLYSRLWCVLEIAEATKQGLSVISAMSEKYVEHAHRRMQIFFDEDFDSEMCLEAAGVSCNTIKAQCRPEDEKLLIGKIKQIDGNFSYLDQVIKDFRVKTLPGGVAIMVAAAKSRISDKQLLEEAVDSLTEEMRVKTVSTEFVKRLQKSGEVSDIRKLVLKGLCKVGEIGDREVVVEVKKHLKDRDIGVQTAAAEALNVLAPDLDLATRHEVRWALVGGDGAKSSGTLRSRTKLAKMANVSAS